MSSQILNKILGRGNSTVLFDFSKSVKENINRYPDENQVLPISPETTSWDDINNILIKDFSFESKDHMVYFVKELILYKHYESLIMTIGDEYINVKVKNIEGESIGKKELVISKYVDEIFEDITYIRF